MFKTFKKYTSKAVFILNIIAVLVMLAVGNTDRLHPTHHAFLSILGMGFGPVLLVNIAFWVFWVFVKIKNVWLPVLGMLLCYVPIRAYTPFNLAQEKPADAIKVLSYNVYLYNSWDTETGGFHPIVDYIVSSKADIVCLQEATEGTPYYDEIWKTFRQHYKYTNRKVKKRPGEDHIVLLSKFPILWSEEIEYNSKFNMSVAYMLDIRGVKTLVVNNHFESYGLSAEDKDDFKTLVKGDVIEKQATTKSKSLLRKVSRTAARRSPQVDAVARYVQKYLDKGVPVILCGDFNDNPISYAHHAISKILDDSYVAAGNGPGFSYHRSGMYFRIDHIFTSSDFHTYQAAVDNSISSSDHYPIYAWVALGKTP